MVHWLSKTEILVRIFVSVQVSHRKRITRALITALIIDHWSLITWDWIGVESKCTMGQIWGAITLARVTTKWPMRFSLTWANRFIYWKMAAKAGNWYQTLGRWVWRNGKRIGLEHSVRQKQDYLLRCSVALGNFPLEPRKLPESFGRWKAPGLNKRGDIANKQVCFSNHLAKLSAM